MKNIVLLLTSIVILGCAFFLSKSFEERRLMLYDLRGYTVIEHSETRDVNELGSIRTDIANPFADEVGDFLKSAYPSEVTGIAITMKEAKPGQVTITYGAFIEKSDSAKAHLHFDHRGYLLSSQTSKSYLLKDVAKRAEVKAAAAKPKFEKAYGETRIVKDSESSVFANGLTCAVAEEFLCSKGDPKKVLK
jgi:hypothetical protein